MEVTWSRRGRLRELIAAFRDSDRQPFPKWEPGQRMVVPGQAGVSQNASRFVM